MSWPILVQRGRQPISSAAVTAVAAAVLLLTALLSTVPGPTAGASADGGAIVPPGGGSPPASSPDRGDYRPPVDAPVVDPFREPSGPYGPGNRGLEYATAPGGTARSIGSGVVVFAGQVAGRLVVSVSHPDGLRSALTGLGSVTVTTGTVVEQGTPLGTTLDRLHLGVRSDGRYLDPALLFDSGPPRRAVLVPGPARVPLGGPGAR